MSQIPSWAVPLSNYFRFILLMLAFLAICRVTLVAQGSSDSQNWANEQLPDTLRLQLLDSLIRKVHWRHQLDSTRYYLDQQRLLAIEKNLPEWEIRVKKSTAKLRYVVDDYAAAIPALTELLLTYDTTDITQYPGLSAVHRDLAYCLRKQGFLKRAVTHYQQAIHYAKAGGEKGRNALAQAQMALGSYYLSREAYDLAEKQYLTSLALSRQLDKKTGIYRNLNNLAIVYASTNRTEKALEYYHASLALKREDNDPEGMANTCIGIGDVYADLGALQRAKDHYLEAWKLLSARKAPDASTMALFKIGSTANRQGQPQQAIEWCSKSCAMANTFSLWQARASCQLCLYDAYKALGQSMKALVAYEAHIAARDTIVNREDTRALAVLEAKLQYEKELAQAETQQLRLLHQAEQEQRIRWALLGLVLLFALVSWFTFRISRLRRQQNMALVEKNAMIAEDRALIQAQANQLAQSVEEKNRFFQNVSHELRTPLTLVISPLEQLLTNASSRLSAGTDSTLRTVQQNANKLLRLVEELLELGRLKSGVAVPERQLVQLPTFVQQIFTNYRLAAEAKQLVYRFDYTLDHSIDLLTDLKRLEKIIDNLLSNAIKFTPVGGEVQCLVRQIERTDPMLQITVSDTGPGISETDLDRIFDRYYQGAAAQEGGTGIGLALAKESAECLGGTLDVSSELGIGTAFTLNLPLVESTPAVREPLEKIIEAPIQEAVVSVSDPAKKRLLIVEDNVELQQFLLQTLSLYTCTAASNGKEALLLLRTAQDIGQPYHLVLTDLMMPEMDGAHLVQAIKKDAALAHTRFVVLTARQEQSQKLAMLRFGVDDYLTKPFSVAELQVRVANLLHYATMKDTSPPENTEGTTIDWLATVEEQVIQLIASQQELTANSLANALNLSNRQLLRKLQSATGLSTQLYIRECKLQLAKQYLDQKRFEQVQEVAKACGFSNASYFSQVFKQRFGVPPQQYLE